MSSEMMKWPYLPGLGSFREEMNKLFEGFTRRGAAAGMGLVPPLDVSETEENILVKVEVPGIEPKDIDISISGDTLTIKGEKKSEKEEKGKNYHFIERSYGSFSRSVGLPASVKFEQVKAEYKKGILEITLPKSEKSKIKKIPVKVS
ncbi:MAG: Hsp20/alpha crystallin family protein [Planctomycetes bacterium]|nr:Hsp20/alpha crystallin family protein [Planctomycetota bacterium]